MNLNIRHLILTILFFACANSALSQKSIVVKQIGKYIAKESVEETGEKIIKKQISYTGKDFAEKAIAKQSIKKVAREKFMLSIKEKGFKSCIEYANSSASKKLINSNFSNFSKKATIHTQSSYKAAIISLRETRDYASRTMTRMLISKKEQFITSKDYISAVASKNVDFKIGYPKDANKLRENMLKCMPEKTKKFILDPKNKNQAHHIIGNATPKAYDKLQKFDIDINDPMNGIFLPTNGKSGLKGTVHHGGHKQDYYDYIENLFSNCNSKQDCYDVLDKIKNELYNGKIELYNTHKVNNTFTNKSAA